MLRIRIWTNPILNGFLSYHASHSGQLIVELWCGSAPKQKGLAHKVVLQMTRAGIGDPETLLTKEASHQWRRESEEIPGLLNRRQHDLLSCRSIGPNKTAAASVANYPAARAQGWGFRPF